MKSRAMLCFPLVLGFVAACAEADVIDDARRDSGALVDATTPLDDAAANDAPDGVRDDAIVDGANDAMSDAPACASGELSCGSACVDPATDAANCGACGHRCASGAMCTDGACCTSSEYSRTTGAISGRVGVCCDMGDSIVAGSVMDCGSGANHMAVMTSPSCADAVEGAMNGGSACAAITCEHAVCM